MRLIYDLNDNRFDVTNLSWGEYWKIQVYDTSQDDLPRKEYDLLKAVADYDSSYFPVSAYTLFLHTKIRNTKQSFFRKLGVMTVKKSSLTWQQVN